MKIGVVMGGISSEREISLDSGKEIISSFNKDKYEVVPIVIDKKEDIITKTKDIDFAFLALHGKFGEDGTVQSVFETLNIPYSGCGPLTSAICMDKDMTKKVLKSAEINTARWLCVKSLGEIDYDYLDEIGYPVFVKPNSGGSSVATNLVKKREDIEDAVKLALKYDEEVMIEEYIKGDEVTCCILNGQTLPIISIKAKTEFFDYKAKYDSSYSDELILKLDKNIEDSIKKVSLDCWNVLKCRVYVRVDLIIKDGVSYVLELNTLPGMTANSLFPKSAKAVNMSYSQLLDKVVEYSIK
ncbi:D-alanine--D-alanine ligase [Clostridium tyrobutyricum]|jgi:D-alanine-D-alanine ligase|uniref:D-alanine--D-alanine ligase n=1 Tax=Clostridium tyrobutyricum DIVETGP TaxID=1408889 RepID=W6N4N7_CLOTY|nr:D-alanine--D-alanine ligase [Clostridium tyrobutyricum]AND84188.1 D-alanine--D-alanine ligase [Clostridium tyrobutyricum]ANP68914.1 D-alanine--D-alanine ligase [Clostridium tyrobutyricum]MBR9648815.1 D-alanine--D-alanine ligase [Clostridium tyrobutyricum]MBV4425352.1 D-alanine--D-alanine ligase [Clostridium tyrobutyricum]MBV4427768.1 D-alanine--D-alanine ligase [Clostridium tyrobutyricum]